MRPRKNNKGQAAKSNTAATPYQRRRSIGSGEDWLYSLQVFILRGPITEEFAKKNKVISRTIEIRGDQTLAELHEAIFDAFDREEEHLYEFQFGERPDDPQGERYRLPEDRDDPFGEDREPAGDVTRTSIGALGLEENQSFGYWFDFGDDWFHQIDVLEIADEIPDGRYPRVTQRVGESPPQYACSEEEEWDDGEWDEEEDEG